jgi:hypothetical protein
MVGLVTNAQDFANAQHLYNNNRPFAIVLDALLNHLNIPGGNLALRLIAWNSSNFDADYQDLRYVSFLNAVGGILETAGALTEVGFVTPETIPTNSPDRHGGGGGNAGGGENDAAVAH